MPASKWRLMELVWCTYMEITERLFINLEWTDKCVNYFHYSMFKFMSQFQCHVSVTELQYPASVFLVFLWMSDFLFTYFFHPLVLPSFTLRWTKAVTNCVLTSTECESLTYFSYFSQQGKIVLCCHHFRACMHVCVCMYVHTICV
jgi:hypothetical protein